MAACTLTLVSSWRPWPLPASKTPSHVHPAAVPYQDACFGSFLSFSWGGGQPSVPFSPSSTPRCRGPEHGHPGTRTCIPEELEPSRSAGLHAQCPRPRLQMSFLQEPHTRVLGTKARSPNVPVSESFPSSWGPQPQLVVLRPPPSRHTHSSTVSAEAREASELVLLSTTCPPKPHPYPLATAAVLHCCSTAVPGLCPLLQDKPPPLS